MLSDVPLHRNEDSSVILSSVKRKSIRQSLAKLFHLAEADGSLVGRHQIRYRRQRDQLETRGRTPVYVAVSNLEERFEFKHVPLRPC
jgi:hypothetical protein